MRIICAVTVVTGRSREHAPGSVLDLPEDHALSLIQSGSARAAPGEDADPPESSKGGSRGAARKKARRKRSAQTETERPDDDALASALIEFAEEGKPTAEAVSKALGREVTQDDVDRVWASLQA